MLLDATAGYITRTGESVRVGQGFSLPPNPSQRLVAFSDGREEWVNESELTIYKKDDAD